jgi:hypothetical protein
MSDNSFRLNAQTPPTKPDTFLSHAQAVFDKVDGDDNGYLSKTELQDAVHNRTITGHDAAAVAVMFKNKGELEELSDDEFGDENDGITRADLAAFAASDDRTQSSAGNYDYAMGTGPVDRANRTLYPKGLASITPDAVDQGDNQCCNFLSALAGLAAVNPKAIQRMITDEGNGVYTVRFPGREPVRTTVSDGELVTLSGSDKGFWVAVLEQAYKEHVNPAEWGLSIGIETLTGHETTTYVAVAPFSLESIREPLKEALDDKRLITASRTWSSNGSLPTQHVYAVMGYDAKTDTIRLRDPKGGETTLTTAEFQDQFDLVAIEDKAAGH